jgi:hypothetical protein
MHCLMPRLEVGPNGHASSMHAIVDLRQVPAANISHGVRFCRLSSCRRRSSRMCDQMRGRIGRSEAPGAEMPSSADLAWRCWLFDPKERRSQSSITNNTRPEVRARTSAPTKGKRIIVGLEGLCSVRRWTCNGWRQEKRSARALAPNVRRCDMGDQSDLVTSTLGGDCRVVLAVASSVTDSAHMAGVAAFYSAEPGVVASRAALSARPHHTMLSNMAARAWTR